MSARVIGLGGATGGDDAVGLAVVEALLTCPPPGAALHAVRDAAAIVDLLDGQPALLVDAVLGSGAAPGTLLEPGAGALEDLGQAWSTHGVSVPTAVALAEALRGPDAVARLHVLGVAIDRSGAPCTGLSPAVRAAVAPAAERARRWVAEVQGVQRG